jgi:hypothetical protein
MAKRGRPKIKRVSGTEYTAFEAASLKYKKKDSKTGSYEIDVDKIATLADQYIVDNIDSNGNIVSMSIPGLLDALGIYNMETYNLWLQGYVNREHIVSDEYVCNVALSGALARANNKIAQYHMEREPKSTSTTQKDIKQLQTMGYLAPDKAQIEHSGHISFGLGGLKRYSN